MGKRFENVSLPREMIEYINELRHMKSIKKKYSFMNKVEFIRRAITSFIEQVEEDLTESEKAELKENESWRSDVG